jgi:hypothetical protein
MHNLPVVAGIAKAEKFQAVGINPETRQGTDPVIKLFDGWDTDVVDLAAILADKMIMGVHDGVEMAQPRSEIEFPYLPLFLQNAQITVNRAQTQARKLAFELLVYLIGRRMFARIGQKA